MTLLLILAVIIIIIAATAVTAIHVSLFLAYIVCIGGIIAMTALMTKRAHRKLKNRPDRWDHNLGPEPGETTRKLVENGYELPDDNY